MAPNIYASPDIDIVVIRSKHQLMIAKGSKILHTFKVALGSGGKKPKLRSGDHLTPTGIYRISKIRNSERFHMFIQVNYPNMKDAVRGLKNQTITRAVYRDIMDAHGQRKLPPQNTKLGGAIGFHGIGLETEKKIEIHEMADWTKGCIAMRNDEIEILRRHVHIGTRVRILD
ncbi:MAG: L,D-transpeptidase [Mycoplasmataceae bacterium]|nr:L,D-transpeptidase [Mycoplasmataceae bacterium]